MPASLLTLIANFIAAFLPVTIVYEYEQAVRFRFGRIVKLYEKPGLIFYIPFIESISSMPVVEDVATTPPTTVTLMCGTTYRLGLAIRYEIANLRTWYLAMRNFDESLVERISGHLPAAVSAMTAVELQTGHDRVLRELTEEIDEALAEWGVNLIEMRFNCLARTRCMDHAVDFSDGKEE